MITKENLHMLEMLADIIHDRTPKPIASEEWMAIRKELSSQGVLTMIALNCNGLQLDSESQTFMRTQLNVNMHHFYRILETQTTMIVKILSIFSW